MYLSSVVPCTVAMTSKIGITAASVRLLTRFLGQVYLELIQPPPSRSQGSSHQLSFKGKLKYFPTLQTAHGLQSSEYGILVP